MTEARKFDLRKFLIDVFDPQATDRVLLIGDLPYGTLADNDDWKERREMIGEWQAEMTQISFERGFEVMPYILFFATGINSGPLPQSVIDDVETATLVLAMTEFSATGPLGQIVKRCPNLRVASMPRLLRRMEQSALAADYKEVQRRCAVLGEIMAKAVFCEVVFDDDNFCIFDLRNRHAGLDNGYLHVDAKERIINLPSGEVYMAPNEADDCSTMGLLPVMGPEELDKNPDKVLFRVLHGKIVDVDGNGPKGIFYRAYFEEDPARRNIAECAFGVNPDAIVAGNVLEDEKAGFHWAFGLSTHMGGIWGPERFTSSATQVHQDVVYARGNPIQVAKATLVDAEGNNTVVIRDGNYVIF